MYRNLTFIIAFIWLVGAPSFCLADDSVVTVRGEAELKVAADQANFELAVVTEATTPDAALAENSRKIEAVLKVLRESGLTDSEIQTGHLVVNPKWSQRPRQATPDWEAKIVGYSVSNQLRIKTGEIAKVGRYIEQAVKAGANEVNGLYFDLADPRRYRQEAISQATRLARQDAEILATAAGAKLGRIVSLTLDDARPMPVRAVVNRAYMAEAKIAPPVISGEVNIQARVTAVYELKD
jgi:uncharacterized protein YggE